MVALSGGCGYCDALLLFVWDVNMLRECDGGGNHGVGDGVVAAHKHMGGTRCSGIVSSADNVLEMSVVRGMRGLVECVKCICV